MTTAERPPRVSLEVGSVAYRSAPQVQGARVAEFDIGELADVVRRNPPSTELQLVLQDPSCAKNLRVSVATVHAEWMPLQPNASLSGDEPHERSS